MKGPIKWMAHNHVASNLLMMVFIVGGIFMAFAIKQEVFPEISFDMVRVSVVYPGAGPEEVESGIILKIEENLSSITGIKEIKSVAAEGAGTVTAELLEGEDIDTILQDIKAEVDRITTFPEDAEKPVVTKLANKREVVSIVVYGDAPERSLREKAEDIRDELLAKPEITQVDLRGVRPYEISVEITGEELQKYGLTPGQIAGRIRAASVDVPGGVIKSGGGQMLVRTKEKKYRGPEYEDISIFENTGGTELTLDDIANVRDGFRETDRFSRLGGQPAAMIAVYRVGDQKPLEISEVVREYTEKKKLEMPESMGLAIWNDYSDIYRSRLNLLLKNAFLGLVLIFLILGLFLQIRLAMWVMLGIPISFLGALLMMPSLDVSINMLSLFAFILALGIVVDDAIVVGENVYTHRSMKKPYLNAAVDGTLEVTRPVIFAVLTTIAAFSPLVFVKGTMGKFIKVIPFVVIPILLVSLVECLLILPTHLGFGKPVRRSGGISGCITNLREGFGSRLESFVAGPYKQFLSLCIRYRYVTFASAVSALLITVGLVGGGVVKFHFMPQVDGDLITASLKMPIGTPVEDTKKAHDYIIRKAKEVIEEYDKQEDETSVLRHIYSTVGSTIAMGGGPGGAESSSGSHLADIALLLKKAEERGIPAEEIEKKWRRAVGDVAGAESVTFVSSLVRFGKNIDIRLAHENFSVLEKSANRIKSALASYPGVSDIDDNYTRGKREIKLSLKPEADMLGITEESLGRQVRDAFYGAEALRIQRGREEVRVMVRYPEEDRKSPGELDTMRIRTPDGREIPLNRAAYLQEGRGFSEINRTDRKRVINITASVDDETANAKDILTDVSQTVLDRLTSDYPGLTYSLAGEEEERRESLGSLLTGFLLSQFLIYCLLAVPFRSYMQPFIIMSAIPFGFVGAVLGHMIMGFNLSILSMFGIVALTGVVVNDSLLLITFINEKRRSGMDFHYAVVEAAQRRFRPIILTSLTTSLGLAPIILEKSIQAQFLIPMAVSLGFGILFATLITLLLIPSIYLILEDVLALLKRGSAEARM